MPNGTCGRDICKKINRDLLSPNFLFIISESSLPAFLLRTSKITMNPALANLRAEVLPILEVTSLIIQFF
jgi:hypothetical protein